MLSPSNFLKKNNLTYPVFLRLGIGILLVFLLVWNVSLEKLSLSFTKIYVPYFLLAITFQFTAIFLGSFNQYILLSPFIKILWRAFLSSYFKAYAIGLLLPGRFGDASIGLFLKEKGIYYSEIYSAYFLDKYLTFIIYLGIFLLFIGKIFGHTKVVSISAWAIFTVVAPLMLYLILKFATFLPPQIQKNRLARFVLNLISQIHHFAKHNPYLLITNFFLTFLKLGLIIFCYYAMFSALNYSLKLWDVGLVSISSGIVAYIPISIQGLGTVETAAIFNFKTIGVTSQDVLACYFLLRLSNYIFALTAYCLSHLYKANKKTVRK